MSAMTEREFDDALDEMTDRDALLLLTQPTITRTRPSRDPYGGDYDVQRVWRGGAA